jgi:transcriptional regulator with XRE-family HTH domain
MDATPRQDLLGRQSTLSLILKAIRQRRGFRSAEVARDMNMALRSYAKLEHGLADHLPVGERAKLQSITRGRRAAGQPDELLGDLDRPAARQPRLHGT